MKSLRRVIIALSSAIIYIIGYLILLSQISIFTSGNIYIFSVGVLLTITPFVVYAWLFIKKFLSASIIGVIAFIGGILISFGFLNEWITKFYQSLFPKVNFSLSGSFSGFWVALVQILILVLLSENKPWRQKIIFVPMAVVLTIAFITIIEIITGSRGQSSNVSIIRFIIYVPVTWILITLGAGYRR